MKLFELKGLPEGLVGKSSVEAKSTQQLFTLFPELKEVEDKLSIEETQNCVRVRGFSPCDG